MSAKQQKTSAGMWDTRTPAYSKETQDLLKVMMKESKLNNFQMRQLQKTVSAGGSLPTSCNPTTSARPAQPVQPVQPSARTNPRALRGTLRTKEDIEESGAYEREQYRGGGVTKSLEKEKQRLQNMMAYGEDLPPITDQRKQELLRTPSPEPVRDRFSELEAEIEERREFLEDMKKLGKEKHYKTIISTEISQKIREMEVIDKQRTQQLKRAIEESERREAHSSSDAGGS
ncbi:UPF0193 protein EVG1-like [Diadema setosum]|uniref:UPF0193 protein EVG1-like n=1 Tax=Diadema setosum TaxID=31175 RepID=UPI003B3A5341